MKYRTLREQELEPLRDEFVNYLAANGMSGTDWKKITDSDADQANLWINQFSQVVWEKSLPKMRALELRLPHSWSCVSVEEEAFEMIRLTSAEPALIQFDKEDLFKRMEENGDDLLSHSAIAIVKGKKAFKKCQNEEVYDLLEQGFTPCNQLVYRALKKAVGES